jgi:hypothetical protein
MQFKAFCVDEPALIGHLVIQLVASIQQLSDSLLAQAPNFTTSTLSTTAFEKLGQDSFNFVKRLHSHLVEWFLSSSGEKLLQVV